MIQQDKLLKEFMRKEREKLGVRDVAAGNGKKQVCYH